MESIKTDNQTNKTEILKDDIINIDIDDESAEFDCYEDYLNYIKKFENNEIILSFSKRFLEFIYKHQDSIKLEFTKNPDYDDINAVKRAINKKLKAKEITLDDGMLRKWLTDKTNPQGHPQSRGNIFKLCYAFELTPEASTELFNKVFFQPDFNSRDLEETVHFFFLKHKRTYNEATNFIKEVSALTESSADTDCNTKQIFDSVNGLDGDIEKFKDYILSESHNFIKYSDTLNANMHFLLESALNLGTDKEISVAQLLRLVFGEDTINYSSSSERDRVNYKTHDFIKNMVPKQITSDFPIEKSMGDMKAYFYDKNYQKTRPSQDSIRKHMIMLSFYNTFKDNTNDYDDFVTYTNQSLETSGLSPLYCRNPYDSLFLYCASQSTNTLWDSISAFQSIYNSLLNEE